MSALRLSEFYCGKKVFVTGHTGFKGTWLCHILTSFGAKVAGYALEPPTKPSLFEQTKCGGKITSIVADIRDRKRLVAEFQRFEPEIAFHLAAQPIVRESYQTPAETYEINVMGAVNFLEALRTTPSARSAVNVTTDKVYENREWLWGYRENENLCGFDPYSNSKSCSELATSAYKNSFFASESAAAISTARSGNVIGGGDYSVDRIVPDCVRAALEKREIVVRNPRSIRPYQHVLECLNGYLTLAKAQLEDRRAAGAYNFGPAEEDSVSTAAIADMFCEAWGGGAKWIEQGERFAPHEAAYLKLDCAKAKTVLGWKPKWNTQTAIAKTVEFAKCENDDEKIECLERQIEEFFDEEKNEAAK